MKILILIMISLSLMFFMLNHPLSMGFNLMIQTIMISLTTGMMSHSFWFSYILFLAMIGGMLILFIYMTSIASNEKFKLNMKLFMYLIIMLMIIISMSHNYPFTLLMKPQEMTLFLDNLNMLNANVKYFTPKLNVIMVCAMTYLLITLLMIVKITQKNMGPLRQKM